MDPLELKKVLQKVEIFFDRDVRTLIRHLETVIAHNQPKEEVLRYAEKLLKALQVAQRIETKERDDEIRTGRKDLAASQQRQITDLQVMIRATQLIFGGDVHQEKKLEDEERDLLYSLREEISSIR